MIKLKVEDYCHSCRDFTPKTQGATIYYAGGIPVEQSNTIVVCRHAETCEEIRNRLIKYHTEGIDREFKDPCNKCSNRKWNVHKCCSCGPMNNYMYFKKEENDNEPL